MVRELAFFDGFTLERIDGGAGASLRVRHGGEGPPVVLLHGHPRTHATWHMVASRLAPHHTVVCPDLRGYGESSKVAPYTKRAMACDVVGVMRAVTPEQMGEQAYADLRRALRDPDVVHAMLEDYRAGLREDREHDEADRAAGRRIRCPLLVVSLLQDDPDLDYGVDIAEIWDAWATDVRSAVIDCGHHVAEEKPDELATLLLDFLAAKSRQP